MLYVSLTLVFFGLLVFIAVIQRGNDGRWGTVTNRSDDIGERPYRTNEIPRQAVPLRIPFTVSVPSFLFFEWTLMMLPVYLSGWLYVSIVLFVGSGTLFEIGTSLLVVGGSFLTVASLVVTIQTLLRTPPGRLRAFPVGCWSAIHYLALGVVVSSSEASDPLILGLQNVALVVGAVGVVLSLAWAGVARFHSFFRDNTTRQVG